MYNNYHSRGYSHIRYGATYPATPYRKNYGTRPYNTNNGFSRKKRSGCTVQKDVVAKTGSKKALIVRGWKYTRKFGMVSFVAVPASSKYQKGKNHTTCVARVTSSMGVSTVWCYWNPSKQILSIPDLRIVASGQQNYVSYLMPKNFKR